MPGLAKAIVVVDNVQGLTAQESAVQTRLGQNLGCGTVSIQDAAIPIPSDVDLVVVCGRSAPRGLRELDVPVLVCNAAALYDLGMATDRPGTDHGQLVYSNVLVCSEALGHPLTAGLNGMQAMLSADEPHGWAKPGTGATSVATVGGDGGKAVVFAYDKGATMPGRDAAGRRVGFLALDAGKATLGPAGWRLFDAAALWAVQGGGAAPPATGGPWFLTDGSPTQALSAREYREWVHEQVGNKLWSKVWTSASYIGFGGVLALIGALATLYAALSGQIGTKVDSGIKEKMVAVDKKLEDSKQALEAQLEKQVKLYSAERVSQLLMNASPVTDKLIVNLQAKADDELHNKLKDPKILDGLVKDALKSLYGEGGLAKALIRRYREGTAQGDAETRRMTLLLIFVFADENQAKQMRPDLLKSLTAADEPEEVLKLALEHYPPAHNVAEDEADLQNVLEKLAGRPPAAALNQAYVQFIARFPDVHTERMLTWLRRRTPAPASDFPRTVLAGMARMKPDDANHPQFLELFVKLAVSANDADRKWGLAGLRRLTENPMRMTLKRQPRRAALDRMLDAIDRSPGLLEDLFPLKNDLSSSILVGLLHPDDGEEVVNKWLAPGVQARSPSVQALLYNWAQRLGLEKDAPPRLSANVLKKLFAVRDGLYGAGTAHLLQYAVRTGDAETVSTLFEKLPELYYGPTYAQQLFRGDGILLAAVEADAGRDPPYPGLVGLLKSQRENPKRAGAFLNVPLDKALRSYFEAQGREVADVARLDDLLQKASVRDAIAETLHQAYTTLTMRSLAAGKAALIVDQYTQIIRREPQHPVWHYHRGHILLTRLHDFQGAMDDFNAALKADPSAFQYYEDRGNAYLKMPGKAGAALDDFTTALKQLRPNIPEVASVECELHRKAVLACALKGDKDDVPRAEEHVKAAIKLATPGWDRARAREALALLYLRRGNWQAALANASAADELYPVGLPWNYLIRACAARKLGQAGEAERALRQWQQLNERNDLAGLYEFIPELLHEQLGIVRVASFVLRSDAARPTAAIVKIHELKLTPGKTYLLDMESTVLDAYLFEKDAAGKVLQEDDDKAGGYNAQLRLEPSNTGTYFITATSFQQSSEGAYALVIRELRTPTQ